MRKKKHFYTVVCLIVGVIILTTAAAANFGNANGYTAYKNSLKKMLDVDNFTATLAMDIIYNGTTQMHNRQDFMFDKDGEVMMYSASFEESDNRNYHSENWSIKDPNAISGDGSSGLSINHRDNTWNINRSYNRGWMSDLKQDEVSRKAIRFAELLADTFVGDLKNNFVLTSERDGLKSYQIILSGNQLPEFVSAGLSMLYSAAKQGSNSFVVYATTETVQTDEEAFQKVSEDAWKMLEKNQYKGVVYVKEDGTLVYFASSDLYYDSEYYVPDMTNIEDAMRTMSTEPTVETAKCFITLDDQGRLVSNTIEGTLSAYDKAGNKHSLTLRVQADLKDYGTTVIAPPVIPETDTVYDYSISSPENQFSYTVRENGIITTYSSDKIAEEIIEKEAEAVGNLESENSEDSAAE